MSIKQNKDLSESNKFNEGSIINGMPIIKRNSDGSKKDVLKRSLGKTEDDMVSKLRKFDEPTDTVIIESETSSKLVIHPLPKNEKSTTNFSKTDLNNHAKRLDSLNMKEIFKTLEEKISNIDKICQSKPPLNHLQVESVNNINTKVHSQFPKFNLIMQTKKIIVENSAFNDIGEIDDSKKTENNIVNSKLQHKPLKSLHLLIQEDQNEKIKEKSKKDKHEYDKSNRNDSRDKKYPDKDHKRRSFEKDKDKRYREKDKKRKVCDKTREEKKNETHRIGRDQERNQRKNYRDNYWNDKKDKMKSERNDDRRNHRRSEEKSIKVPNKHARSELKLIHTTLGEAIKSHRLHSFKSEPVQNAEYIIKDEYLDPAHAQSGLTLSEQVLEDSFKSSIVNKSTIKDKSKISENIKKLLSKKSLEKCKSVEPDPAVIECQHDIVNVHKLIQCKEEPLVADIISPQLISTHSLPPSLETISQPIPHISCPDLSSLPQCTQLVEIPDKSDYTSSSVIEPTPPVPAALSYFAKTINISFRISPKKMQTSNIFSTIAEESPIHKPVSPMKWTAGPLPHSNVEPIGASCEEVLPLDNHLLEPTFKVPFNVEKKLKKSPMEKNINADMKWEKSLEEMVSLAAEPSDNQMINKTSPMKLELTESLECIDNISVDPPELVQDCKESSESKDPSTVVIIEDTPHDPIEMTESLESDVKPSNSMDLNIQLNNPPPDNPQPETDCEARNSSKPHNSEDQRENRPKSITAISESSQDKSISCKSPTNILHPRKSSKDPQSSSSENHSKPRQHNSPCPRKHSLDIGKRIDHSKDRSPARIYSKDNCHTKKHSRDKSPKKTESTKEFNNRKHSRDKSYENRNSSDKLKKRTLSTDNSSSRRRSTDHSLYRKISKDNSSQRKHLRDNSSKTRHSSSNLSERKHSGVDNSSKRSHSRSNSLKRKNSKEVNSSRRKHSRSNSLKRKDSKEDNSSRKKHSRSNSLKRKDSKKDNSFRRRHSRSNSVKRKNSKEDNSSKKRRSRSNSLKRKDPREDNSSKRRHSCKNSTKRKDPREDDSWKRRHSRSNSSKPRHSGQEISARKHSLDKSSKRKGSSSPKSGGPKHELISGKTLKKHDSKYDKVEKESHCEYQLLNSKVDDKVETQRIVEQSCKSSNISDETYDEKENQMNQHENNDKIQLMEESCTKEFIDEPKIHNESHDNHRLIPLTTDQLDKQDLVQNVQKEAQDGENYLKNFLNRFVYNTINSEESINGVLKQPVQLPAPYNPTFDSNLYNKQFTGYNLMDPNHFQNSTHLINPNVYNHSNYSLTNIFQPTITNAAYPSVFDHLWFLPHEYSRSFNNNNSNLHHPHHQYVTTNELAYQQTKPLHVNAQPPFIDSGYQTQTTPHYNNFSYSCDGVNQIALKSPQEQMPANSLQSISYLPLPNNSINKKSSTSSLMNEVMDMDLGSDSFKSDDSRHAVDVHDELSDKDDLSSCGEFEFEPSSPLDPFEKFPLAPRPEYEHIIETEVHSSAIGKRFEYAYLKSTVCNCVPPNPDEVKLGKTACGENCFNRRIKVECNRKCPVYELCTNRRFQEQIYTPFEPFYCDNGKGWGIRSTNKIYPGTFIIEYVGELIDFDEFLNRIRQKCDYNHHFIMSVQKDMYIDAGKKGNWSRFVNHSCDPNTIIERWVVNGKTRIGFFSKKFITENEEITIDYQFQQYGMIEQKCFCNSANCTGVMGKVNEKLQEQIKTSHIRQRKELIQKITSRSCLKDIGHVSDMITVFKEECLDRDTFNGFLHVLLRTDSEVCIRTFIECGGLRVITSYLDSVPWNDWPLKLLYLQCLDHFKLKKRTIISSGCTAIRVVEYWSENPRYTLQHCSEPDSDKNDNLDDVTESNKLEQFPDEAIPLERGTTIKFTLNDSDEPLEEIETQIKDLALNINQYFASEKEKFYIPKKKIVHSDSLADLSLNDSESKSKDSASRASSVQGDYVRSKKRKIRRKCTEAIQKLSKDEFRRLFSERHAKSLAEKNQITATDNTMSLSNVDMNSLEAFQVVKKLLSNVIIDEINRLKQSDKFLTMPAEFQNLDLDKILSDLNIVGHEGFISIMNQTNDENKTSSASTYSNSSSKSADDNCKSEISLLVNKPIELPPNWNSRRSENGKLYYYNIITKKTQWDIPDYPWDAGEEDPMAYDFGNASQYPVTRKDVQIMYEELKKRHKLQKIEEKRHRRLERSIQRKLNLTAGERNKIEFSKAVFRAVKTIVKPYNSSSCKVGRIQRKQDLKFLCEKFADTIITKEAKLVANLEDLEMNANVQSKIKTYIEKYMANQGRLFKRSLKTKPKSKQQLTADEQSVDNWLANTSQTTESSNQLLPDVDNSPHFSP